MRRGLPHDLLFSDREPALKVIFLTLLAWVLRYVWYDAQPLWTDEVITWEFAKATWDGLLWRQLYDASPPGFYLLLKTWLNLARSNAEMRWLPALFGAATVPLAYWLGARVHSRAAGLLAALLLALNPLHLYYSNEVRYPAVLTFLLTGQVILLVNTLRRQTWPWFAAWSLVTAAALWVQYFTLFFLAVEGGYVLFRYRRQRRVLWRWSVAVVAAVLLFLPWWTEFALQWSRGKSSREFFGFFEQLFLGPAFMLLGGSEWSLPGLLGVAPQSAFFVPLALVFMTPFLAAFVLGCRRDRRADTPALLSALVIGVFVLLLVAGLFVPMFRPKYLLPLLPPAAVLAGAGLSALAETKRVCAWLLTGLIVAVSVHGLVALQTDERLQKEPWRAVEKLLESHAETGDALAVPNDYYSIALWFAVGDGWPIEAVVHRGPHERLATEKDVEQTLGRLFKQYRRVWYIDHDSHLFDPQDIVGNAFKRLGREVTRESFLRDSRFSVRLFARDEQVARQSMAGEVNWQTSDFVATQLVSGLDPGPPGFAWMGKKATVRLGRRWREDLAYACFYVHRPFFGEHDPVFTLRVDKTTIATQRASDSDLFCLEGVLPPAVMDRDLIEVSLLADRAFVPDEVLGDGDRTEKSVLVQRIGLSRSIHYWELP